MGSERPGEPGFDGPYSSGFHCLACGANVGPDKKWLQIHREWHERHGD